MRARRGPGTGPGHSSHRARASLAGQQQEWRCGGDWVGAPSEAATLSCPTRSQLRKLSRAPETEIADAEEVAGCSSGATWAAGRAARAGRPSSAFPHLSCSAEHRSSYTDLTGRTAATHQPSLFSLGINISPTKVKTMQLMMIITPPPSTAVSPPRARWPGGAGRGAADRNRNTHSYRPRTRHNCLGRITAWYTYTACP